VPNFCIARSCLGHVKEHYVYCQRSFGRFAGTVDFGLVFVHGDFGFVKAGSSNSAQLWLSHFS
jgi:hypothetical protein